MNVQAFEQQHSHQQYYLVLVVVQAVMSRQYYKGCFLLPGSVGKCPRVPNLTLDRLYRHITTGALHCLQEVLLCVGVTIIYFISPCRKESFTLFTNGEYAGRKRLVNLGWTRAAWNSYKMMTYYRIPVTECYGGADLKTGMVVEDPMFAYGCTESDLASQWPGTDDGAPLSVPFSKVKACLLYKDVGYPWHPAQRVSLTRTLLLIQYPVVLL